MNLKELFLLSLENLLSNKLRSFLTMLGIVVGISALIVVFAIGEGGKVLVIKEVENFGSNLILVRISYEERGRKFLSIEDAEIIKNNCPDVVDAAPVIYQSEQIQRRDKIRWVWIMGTTAGYEKIRNTEIFKGRFINKDDLNNRRRVCILDEDTVKELFGEEDPIGKKVKIGFFTYSVIGVVKTKTSSFTEIIQEKQPTILPISVVQKFTQDKYVPLIFAQAKSYESIDNAVLQIKDVLQRKGITQESIKIQTLKDVIEAIQKIVRILSLIIGGVASVSLLVGGVGIMNIMFVSVIERTREIGIRKAIGARKKDLLLQFLIEAVSISTMGGIIGIILGIIIANISASFAKWPPIVKPKSVILAFIFSFSVGIFFGVYPAYKAANLNPVEALRYE
jgi:putative ABC transport system permease protein